MTQDILRSSLPEPIAVGLPLPHRKVIRSWLKTISDRRTALAVLLLFFDWACFALLITGTALLTAWWAKLICGLAAGIVIGRLFIIGHDACHQSYTPHRRLNKVLGRIAMVPSITPYSLWQVGHNVVHHGYANLKGVDFVWAPLTREEFQALSPARQVMERIYRSGWGSWLHYFVEMWWLRMFFPSKDYIATRRKEFLRDSTFAAATGLVWIASLIGVSYATDQSAWALVGFGFGGLFHHIMEHTAHHEDMSIPLYRLKGAQQLLEDTLPERIIVQHFSWCWYAQTARRCKLYDFQRRCWTDFQGIQTSESKPTPA